MSIEQALAANTAASEALRASIDQAVVGLAALFSPESLAARLAGTAEIVRAGDGGEAAPGAGDAAPAAAVEGTAAAARLTIDDVRAAVGEFSKAEGKAAARAILEKHDSTSVSGLDPRHYASVVKACELPY